MKAVKTYMDDLMKYKDTLVVEQSDNDTDGAGKITEIIMDTIKIPELKEEEQKEVYGILVDVLEGMEGENVGTYDVAEFKTIHVQPSKTSYIDFSKIYEKGELHIYFTFHDKQVNLNLYVTSDELKAIINSQGTEKKDTLLAFFNLAGYFNSEELGLLSK